jgi:RNA polymerase sigma factor (sigma-70 family)
MTEHEAPVGAANGELERRWLALAAVRDDALRVVRRRIAHAQDAEDHVHEAMVRLVQRDTTDAGSAHLRGLLVTTAYGIAIDGHRSSGRQHRLLPRLLGGGRDDSPEEIVADRSEARWMAAGVGSLGVLEREALVHAMEGRRPAEIAALLGVEYKAAENALGRARRKLRLRAATIVIGLSAVLRRLRCEEHHTALTASALAAFILLGRPGTPPDTGSRHPGQVADLPSATVRLVVSSAQSHAAAPSAAARVPAPAPTAIKETVRTAPPPPSRSPSPTVTLPAPWQGSPGVQTTGRAGLRLPAGSPGAWLITCVQRQPQCIN